MLEAKHSGISFTLNQLEYSSKRGIERSVVLSLANNEYIAKWQNVLITPPYSKSPKTHHNSKPCYALFP